MEHKPSSLASYNSIIYFSIYNLILIIFIILLLVIFCSITLFIILVLKRKYFDCKCDICHSYVTLSWSKKFPNLSDWITYLLQNSPTKTIHIHVLNNIITANPNNVEYMLKVNFDNYPKGKPFSSILGDLLGNGIFNVDGDKWRFQKKMLSLELDRRSVRSFYHHVVQKEIDHHLLPYLFKQVDGSKVIDLQETFRAFSFSTICQFSFGVEMRKLQGFATLEEFSTSFDLASSLSAMRALEVCSLAWKVKRLFGIGKEKKLKKAMEKVDALAMAIIELRKKMESTSSNSRKDLLSRFMSSMIGRDDKYLRDIIISFMLAGRDTIASALTSFLWLVTIHPQVKSSILSEADKLLLDCNLCDRGRGHGHGQEEDQGVMEFEELKRLHYLQASIYESMRLYPPIQFNSKFPLKNDILPDGTKVKKGTRVTYHPYAMGRMKDIWGEDCFQFKPERWLNKQGEFNQENCYKYPIFQAGIRVCLGKEMALMEIKCVILSILRHFNIELATFDDKQVPKFSPGLTATFKGGLPVVLHRKTNTKDMPCHSFQDE